MALFNPPSIAIAVLLLYLSTFLLFAILRITTGISIQRVGYFSLRRIAYAPKEGIWITVRGLGLSLHRPTFTQPTWISVKISELKITVDPAALGGPGSSDGAKEKETQGPFGNGTLSYIMAQHAKEIPAAKSGRSQLWKQLTGVKEKIKRLHRKINYLRAINIVAINTTLHILDVGQVQVGAFSMAVDTRRKTVDRNRLFRHKKDPSGDQRPAEWIFAVKTILFMVEGREATEVLDNLGLNIHGILYKELEGLRDTSIALRLGRLHIPCDDILQFSHKLKQLKAKTKQEGPEKDEGISFAEVVEELDQPGTREETIVQTVADSKEFVSSLLRGVQEIQVALIFFRLSQELKPISTTQTPVFLNVVTHEIGIDLHRLDQKTPAHRMYFSRGDVAHQALVAAISISVTLDNGSGESGKLLYIPMATTTIKTTLPSKTLSNSDEKDAAERNANVLFANLVVTSPSVDLEPRQLSQLIALSQVRSASSTQSTPTNHRLISRLLPKASIKLSVHEPVIRFVLPITSTTVATLDDYDLLICSISSIALDIESSYSSVGEFHYALSSSFRIASHQLYYQNALGERHNLLITEALELKLHLSATPQVYVVITGNLRTFSVHMVRQEVSIGVQRVVKQFRNTVQPERLQNPAQARPANFLRRLPPWLLQFSFEGSDFGVEVGGVDHQISKSSRGLALQLESWTAEYRAQKEEHIEHPHSRRRTMSNSTITDDPILKIPPMSPSRKHSHAHSLTDGRRLAFHVRGFEGFIVESTQAWEQEPFLSLPRFEVALSTSSDNQGLIFHVNSFIKAFYMEYSLYRHYAIGVAGAVLKDAFAVPYPDQDSAAHQHQEVAPEGAPGSHLRQTSATPVELTTVDVKASLIQVKAIMPADPPLMLQIYNLTAGSHRWSAPFMKARVIRLNAEAPQLKRVWARVVSINNLRLDLREAKRKHGRSFVDEKSIDVSTDFVRLAVPHNLTTFKIFDNCINTAKATAQLHHRFKTRTNEYILRKEPEGPKKIPRVSLRCKALLFELEDDAFEWRLASIYRLGLVEQKQRLAREDAYRLKVKRLEENQPRRESKLRSQSTHVLPQSSSHHDRDRHLFGHHRNKSADRTTRNRSADRTPRTRSTRSRSRGRHRQRMRYDPEGICKLTGEAKVSAKEVWLKLQQHNARSWKKRIDWSMQYQNAAVKDIRKLFAGADEPDEDMDHYEPILGVPNRPGLMATLVSDLHLVVDKPSFPVMEYRKFLHTIGKGMPLDMEYALLIPVSIQLDMGESRVTLRDYPLDLLHIPAIRSGQSPRLPSWSLRTDFVIAEEFRDDHSLRHIKVDVIKPSVAENGETIPGFSIDVRRTVSPVKTYSDVNVDVNTSAPTVISWGNSYQPVIQDMMMIIEGFTKPEIDPSDRVGFWDKIRLSQHSRIRVAWKEDGDFHLRLKGSRDPYVVTGYGAGFVMCWRNDVRFAVHETDDPKKFLTVTSGEYVLAVPDYSHQALQSAEVARDNESMSTTSSHKNAAVFKKVIMKLSGNVRWLAGLVFEQNLEAGGRSFSFSPHYNVILKNPLYIKREERENYDAFRGFRSHNIHLSVAVTAPYDREWTVDNRTPSTSYNTVHLSPRFFTHFFSWWSLFSGIMSLPIRQGDLWPGVDKTSKKFGRHLATIKYSLLLSPLFLAHIYKHKDAEDYAEDIVSATGLKVRLDSFMLDMHQRRESFDTQAKGKTKSSGMRIHQAQLDFISADVRAVSAMIGGTTPEALQKATDEILSSYQQPAPPIDMSRFTIPDHDMTWIDMDDFVELDWVLPSESNPETHILPLAFAPRFTYLRHTHNQYGKGSPSSPFGDENTHFCVMTQDNDPRRVQLELLKERLEDVDKHLESHRTAVLEQELKVVRDSSHDKTLKEQYNLLASQGEMMQHKRDFIQAGIERLSKQLANQYSPSDNEDSQSSHASSDDGHPNMDPEMDGLYSSPNDELTSDFDNRFVVHNTQLKWNNSLRNIILRYTHQVSQRRGFIYYMSRRAVRFILDIVDEQAKSKQRQTEAPHKHPSPSRKGSSLPSVGKDSELSVEDRISQLLNDAKRFVDADDPESAEGPRRPTTADRGDKISDEFTAQNSYHIRLIAPQIQLLSEKNTKSVLLITAKGMQLKIVSIMDRDRVGDDVSGLVQRRFALDMDGAQFFVTDLKKLTQYIHLYSGNRYGNAPGSSWPPWVSLEVMFDFKLNPFGFSRVIQKTSASLRYDKYNTLRLKYNEEVASEEPGEVQSADQVDSRIDHLWLEFPKVHAICDSAQYYAIYIIVLDLLMYSEPLEKIRSERLERIMLASDFSDLRGAPEIVESLQERIRQLEEIKNHFQIHAKFLDRQGWQDRISLEQDLANCEDELFFIMKAITTSQRKHDDRGASQSNGLLRWYLSASEIVWHLMREKNEPLLEFQLRNAAYERTDNSDGSNHNTMEVDHIHGLNLLSNALYPELIGPYHDHTRKGITGRDDKMLRIQWYMLEAIAGIPVLDDFEVNLFPLKIQLERELGKKLFEYIFPGMGSDDAPDTGFSPLMVKHMRPVGEDGSGDEQAVNGGGSSRQNSVDVSREDVSAASATTRPGGLEHRLKPTLALPASSSLKAKGLGIHTEAKDSHSHFRLFQPLNRSQSSASRPASARLPTKRVSAEDLRLTKRSGTSSSFTNLSSLNGNGDKPKKHGLVRSSSKDRHDKEKASDDLTQMLSRASNYMTLAHVKISSVVLCLSYKGKGERNIEDVHDFVFRMPVLEYRNKTWSNLDLALRLKKDVIRALISHTGAIIGNKFSHHRPNKTQLTRLRELANASQVLPNTESLSNASGSTSTFEMRSQEDVTSSPGQAFALAISSPSPISRTSSYASSFRSSATASIASPEMQSKADVAHDTNGEHHGGLLRNTFARRFTTESHHSHNSRSPSQVPEDPEESNRKKTVLLLGKKILGTLS